MLISKTPKPILESSNSKVEETKIEEKVKEIKVDLDKDINASAARLTELRAGRNHSNILLTDEYWIALQNHNKYFGVNS